MFGKRFSYVYKQFSMNDYQNYPASIVGLKWIDKTSIFQYLINHMVNIRHVANKQTIIEPNAFAYKTIRSPGYLFPQRDQ